MADSLAVFHIFSQSSPLSTSGHSHIISSPIARSASARSGPSPLSADDGDGLTFAATDTILFHSALDCHFPVFLLMAGFPAMHFPILEDIVSIDWKNGTAVVKWLKYNETTVEPISAVKHLEVVKRKARKARRSLDKY
ncbi:hypothetical protein J8273_7643 [Carpediemonas membranifera]|uniref:Uncharacterized protein n=1 Tax=Carpediemonas membranifera TaxID=201153 RepID=A0A8J6AQD0_9EUKA|nr:hypothetical protein J8273_7643 [Carpediemonas membranifera]|eukprot:KAG9391276.1 hypothetical protein J8273_7643 [Carpediemonas membranifera]